VYIRKKVQNIQYTTDHMKHKKKEDQSVDASVLLRKGNKIIMGSRGLEGVCSSMEGATMSTSQTPGAPGE
jgi:hypothetical protein